MRNPRATEIKVGVTVLLGLLVFIWILGWAKNFSISSSDNLIKVRFNKVSGLEVGNNVTVNGVRKGVVKEFVIQGSSVIVTLSLSNEIQLKKDARFSLESTDLMGGRKIEVDPGTSDESMDYSVVQQGNYISDIAGVISLFSDIQDKISIIANESVRDVDGVLSLMSDDVSVEDPVGGPPGTHVVGRDAVERFFRAGFAASRPRPRAPGPVCTTAIGQAAFAFVLELELRGVRSELDVIDVMRFDSAGRIRELRAFWNLREARRVS